MLPEPERTRELRRLQRSDEDAEALEYDWSFWSRPKQRAPVDVEWYVWFLLAGRGFGKTRCGAEWVRSVMCGKTPDAPGLYRHIALVAETAKDARDVMIGAGRPAGEGSGILQVHPKEFRPEYEKSNRRLVWPNGAIASIYNATEPDQLRGPEHEAAWCDEIAKWQYLDETWDNLQFGLRRGVNPRIVITTTPKPIKLIKEILSDKATRPVTGSTFENESNLAPKFLDTMKRKYEGTRIGRQELAAEILEDIPGAMWKRAQFEVPGFRVKTTPDLRRIVVAIDPSGSDGDEENEQANSIGIVAAGMDYSDRIYVLADRSCDMGPDGWGRRAVALYSALEADRIVAEKNFGGAMVSHVIRTVNRKVPVKLVHASRGKTVRAEPVQGLYEQKKVHHVGTFGDLEDQMCAFTQHGFEGGGSPDRVDALVWAITELAFGKANEASSGHVGGLI